MENGDVFLLERLESVEGNLTDIHASREAMGSGDAWILMMAGCACGWQGALFSLFLGSLLGIVQPPHAWGSAETSPLAPLFSAPL